MANPFVHVELNTTDVGKAKTFYGALFNWTLEDIQSPGGGYTMIKVGEGTGGGIMKHPCRAHLGVAGLRVVDDVAASPRKLSRWAQT